MKIKYRAGYKYQLHEDYGVRIPVHPNNDVWVDYGLIRLTTDGQLVVSAGYAWDGPSGPTIDTKNSMRASLVHDVLYELIRKSFIPYHYRAIADKLLYEMCVADGMFKWRAWLWYRAVRRLAFNAADPASIKKVITAPGDKVWP